MMGAFGYISPSQVEELSRSRDLRDLSKNIIAILPIDLASKLEIKPEKPLALLEASIDQAVCRYIKARSEEIGTREVRQSWDLLARMYEIKNLSLIARLKRFNVPSDQIKPFLFPCSAEVDERFLRALLESTDYPAFIQLLRETHYGRYLPTTKDELSPAAIEEILMEALLKKMVSEIPSEDGLEAAIRYMINLELEFQTIREAAFFAIIKGNGGRNP
jgi:vacuolar-type H+-ATPase subunit C/Vma6